MLDCDLVYILLVFYTTGKMWLDGIGHEEVENIWTSEGRSGREGIKSAKKKVAV